MDAPVALGDASAPARNLPTPEESHEWMVQRLAEVREATAKVDMYQGDGRMRELRARVGMHGKQPPWRLVRELGLAEMRYGEEESAVGHLQAALASVGEGLLAGDRATLRQLHFDLGVAALRLGETENCCAKPTPDSCILPLSGGGLHTETRGAEVAKDHLTECLKYAEKHSPPWYAAVWLLNVAHQTLGSWPEGLDSAYRLPEAAFAPVPGVPEMVNVAQGLGLDSFSLAGGVIVEDFTNDGWLDLMISSWDTGRRLKFFVNRGDGTFEEKGVEAGLSGLLGGLNMIQGDYDNDGDMDFFVLRGGWLARAGKHPNSLVRNNGDGTFTDVTAHVGISGLDAGDFPTQTAGFADYDLDGDLDLYVGNESSPAYRCGSQLFRNDGELGFTEVAEAAGVLNERYCKGISWGDYDNDGDPDLYVSNNGDPNRLYRNNGDGTFTDVAGKSGVSEPVRSFPCWFWDQNNDGNLDLFVSAYSTDIAEVAAHYRGEAKGDLSYEAARLYLGDGEGGFVEQRLDYPALPMGSNFGDLNGDGRLDIALATGNTYIHSVMPNLLFLQEPDGGFRDATMGSRLGHLQKGHGVAFADLDHDGDLDLFHQMGGAYAGDGAFDALYENRGVEGVEAPAWIAVTLVGTRSNRCALGARIEVLYRARGPEGEVVKRSVHRVVGSGGSFGASPLRQVIGLGPVPGAEQASVKVRVAWPSGARGDWSVLPIRTHLTLTEGQEKPLIRRWEPVRLGGN